MQASGGLRSSGVPAPQADHEGLLQQIKMLEKDKQGGDLKLKQYFVRRITMVALGILKRNSTHESLPHDNYFDYYFPNGSGKFFMLSVNCEGFSYGHDVDLDSDAAKVEEMQKTSKRACYQFLRDRTAEELIRRGVRMDLIEPSVTGGRESPLVRTAVLSVMEFIEVKEAELSLMRRSKRLLEDEALWQVSDSWEPLSDPWYPISNDDIDTTFDDLMKEHYKQIREQLVDLVKAKVLKRFKKDESGQILITYNKVPLQGASLDRFNKKLLEFHKAVEASSVKFSSSSRPPVPVKRVCFNYLLTRTDYSLRGNNIYVHFIDDLTRGHTNYLRGLVMDVMNEVEKTSLAPALTDKKLWLKEYDDGGYNEPIEEPSNCVLF